MSTERKILGQLRPANTTAASLYSPGSNITAEITTIVVCNQGGNNASFRVFHDDDGTTYDETTALFWDVDILANETVMVQGPLYINNSSGNLGVRTSAGNELTFTAYGFETTGITGDVV